MELSNVSRVFNSAIEQIGKVVVGQMELVEGVLVALFSEGSVLIEGPPGLGKTLLVNVLSKTVNCDFNRVQFTPDLMPSDLTGHSIYDMKEQQFRFNKGPVFTNILLTDEINRSPPKTQASLLEVMQERQVTVDGTTHVLDRPFLVIATQNPIEHEGTYPLPEAQVDRFMFKLLVDYPSTAVDVIGPGAAPPHDPGQDKRQPGDRSEVADTAQQHRRGAGQQRRGDRFEVPFEGLQRDSVQHVVAADRDDSDVGPRRQDDRHLIAQNVGGSGTPDGDAVDRRVEAPSEMRADPPHPDLIRVFESRPRTARIAEYGDPERREIRRAEYSRGVGSFEPRQIAKSRVEDLTGQTEEGSGSDPEACVHDAFHRFHASAVPG